ncbi:hypothetical protein ABZ854_35175, partial [Streptomyces sp. NPDC047028]
MRTFSRRRILGLGASAAAVAGLAGCGSIRSSLGDQDSDSVKGADPGTSRPAKLIGDGSTSFTGRQPHQPAKPEPLEPGQTPP